MRQKPSWLRSTDMLWAVVLVLLTTGAFAETQSQSPVEVYSLLCEYQVDPIGLDELRPRLYWKLSHDARGCRQTAYQVQVSVSRSELTKGLDLIWDSGRVDSTQSIHVVYAGPPLESRLRYYWRVRVWDQDGRASVWSNPALWEMGLLRPSDWKASWIVPDLDEDTSVPQPAPMLRTVFDLPERVKSARLHVTSKGLYDVELNGVKVSSQIFTPGWTSYRNRLQYQTYDVTGLLKQGANAAGVRLGDGWYRGYIGFKGQRNYYGKELALLFQLQIELHDGSTKTVCSDESWRSAYGPIRMSDIYMGETYDARLEQPGWSQAQFDDSNWSRVKTQDYPKDHLVAPAGPPILRQEEIRPVEILKTPSGQVVYDLGQNMVGRVRLKIQGNRGDIITLRHAEVLDQKGGFYTENLRSAAQTVQYILKGNEEETYEPIFTFQGFRYVLVEGLRSEPRLDHITGIVIHSSMAKTGAFQCSNPELNQLQHNILWGQKGNFLDVPTDCPQRDERLGWTGDAQVFARTAAFNMDVAGFFTKWLGDLAADQLPDGRVPHVVPDVLKGFASAAWADAAVVVPWTIYLCYGDTRILENQYESMKAWVDWVTEAAGDDYLWDSGFHFGDWLAYNTTRSDYPGATTDKDLIATALFGNSTRLLQQTARVLGKKADAAHYEGLFQKIKQAFDREFVTPNGRLASNTQTAYTLALRFGLLPETLRKAAANRLVQDIEAFDTHLTTGFVGTPYLCHVLSDTGHLSTAYALLLQKTYPSWLYPITKGATTIWERWDGIKPDGSFQDPGMNSFNHYAYGAIGEWLYRVVAGIEIDPQRPGYRHVLIQPRPGGDLKWVKSTLLTLYGEVVSDWKYDNRRFHLTARIPPNTEGTIVLPSCRLPMVTESGRNLSNVMGIQSARQTADTVVVKVGSGNYNFSCEPTEATRP